MMPQGIFADLPPDREQTMKLSDMRREYESQGLRRADLDPNPLVQRLHQQGDGPHTRDLVSVIYEQARLAGGENLKDAAGYVRRINALLLELQA